MSKIVLVGYMGSGKSTIGKILSEKTGIPFFDLDEIIEKNTLKTISELFLEIGEIKFRKLEHETVSEFFNAHSHFILSFGGGTPCYANNHLYLQREDVISIYLKASISELVKRLIPEKRHRPLIASMNNEDLESFLARHLFERSYFYHQAKQIVTVDNASPSEIVRQMESLLV